MKVQKVLAALLACSLIFTAVCAEESVDPASSSSDVTSEPASAPQNSTLSLAYSSTDSLDPYAAVTRYNQELCGLLYDSLIVLDDAFCPVYRLAEEITREGKTLLITIKAATFSDGSAVTAEDVVYSIGKARDSQTKYKEQLAGITAYSAAGSRDLELTIANDDPYFINLLDFPILKKDSDQRKNEDGKALPPVGSGRYVFSDGTLTANPDYIGGSMAMQTVRLVDTPDKEAYDHNLEMGNIDLSFSDLSDNVPLKMTGQSQAVQLNRLVYLGINFSNGYLAEPQFRQALALAIDREKLVSDCYFNYATPAAGPFPNSWSEISGLQTISSTANAQRAVAIFDEIGYNSKDEDGYLLNSGGERITFTMLVNLDNTARVTAAQLIKAQLAAVGIAVEIRTVNWTAYQSELSSGAFDLYLGEVRLKNNMDLSPLVTEKSGACFGYIKTKTKQNDTDDTADADADVTTDADADESDSADPAPDSTAPSDEQAAAYITVSAYDMIQAFYDGKSGIADVTAAFLAELPVIPLLHRMGQVAYSADMTTGPDALPGDLWNGIENIAY